MRGHEGRPVGERHAPKLRADVDAPPPPLLRRELEVQRNALGVLPWYHITGMECQMNMMAYLGATEDSSERSFER